MNNLARDTFPFMLRVRDIQEDKYLREKIRLVIVYFIKIIYFAIMWFFLQCLHKIWLVVSIFYYFYPVFKNSVWIAELDFSWRTTYSVSHSILTLIDGWQTDSFAAQTWLQCLTFLSIMSHYLFLNFILRQVFSICNW